MLSGSRNIKTQNKTKRLMYSCANKSLILQEQEVKKRKKKKKKPGEVERDFNYNLKIKL